MYNVIVNVLERGPSLDAGLFLIQFKRKAMLTFPARSRVSRKHSTLETGQASFCVIASAI